MRKDTDPPRAQDFLLQYTHTRLSPEILIKLMESGAVWLKRGKVLRLRDPGTLLQAGDTLELYYDPRILELPPSEKGICLHENAFWGIWYKPAGILGQGSLYGDHSSLLRQVEKSRGQAFLVHRLDREVSGLMIFAYKNKAAADLSRLWAQKDVGKYYQAIVLGDVRSHLGDKGELSWPLDGKPSQTLFRFISYKAPSSQVLVKIETGRKHQIRRHWELAGHPIMGDPRYGRGNKNREGLQLMATRLEFSDPATRKRVDVELPRDLRFFEENSF